MKLLPILELSSQRAVFVPRKFRTFCSERTCKSSLYLLPAFLILKVITVPATGRLGPAGTGHLEVWDVGKWRGGVATFSNKTGFLAPLAQPLTRGTQTEEVENSDQRKA